LVKYSFPGRWWPIRAERRDSPAQLAEDGAALERFVTWVRENDEDQVSVLFTPWGEALTRCWYREALVELSRLPHVPRAAIQTNLAADLGGWGTDGGGARP
jgi:hypothetical protein